MNWNTFEAKKAVLITQVKSAIIAGLRNKGAVVDNELRQINGEWPSLYFLIVGQRRRGFVMALPEGATLICQITAARASYDSKNSWRGKKSTKGVPDIDAVVEALLHFAEQQKQDRLKLDNARQNEDANHKDIEVLLQPYAGKRIAGGTGIMHLRPEQVRGRFTLSAYSLSFETVKRALAALYADGPAEAQQ